MRHVPLLRLRLDEIGQLLSGETGRRTVGRVRGREVIRGGGPGEDEAVTEALVERRDGIFRRLEDRRFGDRVEVVLATLTVAHRHHPRV